MKKFGFCARWRSPILSAGLAIAALAGVASVPWLLAQSSTSAQAQDVMVIPSDTNTDSMSAQSQVLDLMLNPKPTIEVVAPTPEVATLPMYKKRLEYRKPLQKVLVEEFDVMPNDLTVPGLSASLSAKRRVTKQELNEMMAIIAMEKEKQKSIKGTFSLEESLRTFMKYHSNSAWNESINANLALISERSPK